MRYALLADVHGNLEALEAVLHHLDDWPEARILCAGDVVGYGPDPEACLELLRSWNAIVVVGNHEAMVLGRIGFSRCVHQGIDAALWTRQVISEAARVYLERLPAVHCERSLVMCHATLDDLETYSSTAAAAERSLARCRDLHPASRILVCGHTHQAMAYVDGEGLRRIESRPLSLRRAPRALVNPGAVGQSRDGRFVACYARYDDESGELAFFELGYAKSRTQKKLYYAGLSPQVDLGPPRSRLAREWSRFRTRVARRRAQRGAFRR